MERTKFSEYNNCFVCGTGNPLGMKVTAQKGEGTSIVTWLARREFEGYSGVLHGGIVSALLDEAMAYATLSIASNCATAEMNVRFLRPVRVGESVRVEGVVTGQHRRLYHTSAELIQDGEIRAIATGKFIAAAHKKDG